MEILVGGDLVPTQSNKNIFDNGEINSLLGDKLFSLWKNADIRIFNLETPLVDKAEPIDKCGPNLISPTSTIKGIKALSPSLITLANNHILDQGIQGLRSTETLLKKNKIPYIGVGDDVNKSSEPYILKRDGISIGIYTCAENEFTIATDKTPGANPFDPLETPDHIEKLKLKCDYVIVLYHGGKEHYRYPSPYLQKACRKIAKKGADIVICQHSHCVGSYEDFEGSTIVYGQGNFIFDRYANEFWNSSLLIKLYIHNGIKIDYIPIVKKDSGVRLATGQMAKDILSEFQERSKEILQDGFIEKKYQEFANQNIQSYRRKFSGFGKWLTRIDVYLFKGTLAKLKYNKKQLLAIQNAIECEAHRELLLAGLKMKKTTKK
ncbi:CapA family protein [Peribacillus simplex]|uniref:CapA family protein n=1 Tax=Peribacillus simplex TaxID=1478 RepID=UPI001921A3BF|nr:CapA family protein [Peribacillus simplex]MBD8591097.1 CapA family protein [Peribacillus simplex]